MEVLIAQKDTSAALDLADEVSRAGGRVTGIAASIEDAFAMMQRGRGPDLLLVDASFTTTPDGQSMTGFQEARGRLCIFTAGAPSEVPDTLRRKWPVLRGPYAHDDIRLLLQAARHFGRTSTAIH